MHSSVKMQRALPVVALAATAAHAIDNGLGFTPGLGWNSDYCLGCDGAPRDDAGVVRGFQNDGFIRHIAEYLVSSGLGELGYVNVNMDAGWDTFSRDARGNLVPDPQLWPDGINSTIAYVHSLGLRFGLYGDRGTLDCSKRPGQQGYETQDAAFIAALEVDWFKEDSCYAPSDQPSALAQYAKMRDALNATGRPIWFALCGWQPWYAPTGKALGNSWRVGVDTGGGWGPVMSNVQAMLDNNLGRYAGPTSAGGGWNDMSLMLLPGMGAGDDLMSRARHRSQFALHCILAANILLTGNLSSIDPYALETWGNAEALAVHQDPAYKPFVALQPEGGVGGQYVSAHVQECGGEPGLQNWTFNAPASQFLFNGASKQCLNVEACGTTIIYDGCTTTGSTCSGPGKFSNEQWVLRGDGALVSALPGSLCATERSDRTLVLEGCTAPLATNQTWAYEAASGQLQTADGMCLTASQPVPPASSTVLVGRQLHDGSWGVLAVNNQPENATVTCGAACFAAMGLLPTQTLRVRDLWAHADVNVTLATALDIPVGANGSSTFLRLTPLA